MNNQQIVRLIQMLMPRKGGKSPRFFLIAGGLIVAYLLLQPVLRNRLGISLPGYGGQGAVTKNDVGVEFPVSPGASGKSAPKFADLDFPEISLPTATKTQTDKPNNKPATQAGTLRELGRGALKSPAGLVYTRGSREGHRLKHVMAHSRDNPNRPGQHGVFDANEQSDVVALIDEAYGFARAGKRTRTKKDDRRLIHTVDMGRRIGYVGGQSGNRRRKPAARHIRLVLEDERVITAFPLIP